MSVVQGKQVGRGNAPSVRVRVQIIAKGVCTRPVVDSAGELTADSILFIEIVIDLNVPLVVSALI